MIHASHVVRTLNLNPGERFMRVGLLTGGGDCAGLNAVIRAVVRKISNAGGSCVGFLEGWRELVENNCRPLEPLETDKIIGLGGTILGSSRT